MKEGSKDLSVFLSARFMCSTAESRKCSFHLSVQTHRITEQKMTSKDFMEYPNANIDIGSLEEVMLYAHGGGRKPVSTCPIEYSCMH